METTNYFFRDMGVMFGRSIRSILRSRDTMILVAIIIMPIAFMLLLIYALVGVIQAVEKRSLCNYRS